MDVLAGRHEGPMAAGQWPNDVGACPPAPEAPLLRTPYHRIVGRFYSLRRLTSAGLRFGQFLGLKGSRAAAAAPRVDAFVRRIRRDGMCPGLQLPPDAVERIYRYGIETPCVRSRDDPERFLFSEIRNGLTPGDTPVAVADVVNPGACDEVESTSVDPLLLETARRYLGYRPRHIHTRLFWSPVSDLADDLRRRNGQTIDFHYDIEACNTFYVYFYITATGPTSGAHVVVTGSHRTKPLSMIFARSYQAEERVVEHYGRNSIAVISGAAGFGFFEDPSCFHKALVPSTGSRLCLQLRYM